MTDVRFALRHGDHTSTGGQLIATGQGKHRGIPLAVEGDLATCPACKSVGQVVNDCYPAFALGGKQVLVEGARVYCRCANPPTCFASQGNFTITVNRSAGRHSKTGVTAGANCSGATSSATVLESNPSFDDRFLLCDVAGRPLPRVAYAIEREDGAFEYGETDSRGHTHLLTSVASSEHVQIYLAG